MALFALSGGLLAAFAAIERAFGVSIFSAIALGAGAATGAAFAGIILACDAYHAMTSDHPYRAATPHAEAVAELAKNAGSKHQAPPSRPDGGRLVKAAGVSA